MVDVRRKPIGATVEPTALASNPQKIRRTLRSWGFRRIMTIPYYDRDFASKREYVLSQFHQKNIQ